ncbi:hypothetical protein [Psychromonas antarctica]|jgi:nicotinate-nucleotide pyrophosphorylase|uniref:hypothetical protein n=1 Tax=Psychromonas antarctica TaxID=67573 RepID=UPI001EE8465E|nr:hypothetical protein [Psychromonas antarctica]MCG6200285.1 hypothetical protein [Psychromonas antarctica]
MINEIMLGDQHLFALYQEDLPQGDLSTSDLRSEARLGRIKLSARYDLCCCAVKKIARLLIFKGLQVKCLNTQVSG